MIFFSWRQVDLFLLYYIFNNTYNLEEKRFIIEQMFEIIGCLDTPISLKVLDKLILGKIVISFMCNILFFCTCLNQSN